MICTKLHFVDLEKKHREKVILTYTKLNYTKTESAPSNTEFGKRWKAHYDVCGKATTYPRILRGVLYLAVEARLDTVSKAHKAGR